MKIWTVVAIVFLIAVPSILFLTAYLPLHDTSPCPNEAKTTPQGSASETSADRSPPDGNSSSEMTLSMPVYLGISLNGTAASGVTNFSVQPGLTSVIDMNVTYPWNILPDSLRSPDTCIPLSFTVEAFPANSNDSTIPSWLHVSLSTSSTDMRYGTNSSVILSVSVERTIVQSTTTNSGIFEIECHFYDPATDTWANELATIRIIS